jgi:hypothetical protein
VKKWIVVAGIVALGVAAFIVVTKPWGPRPAAGANAAAADDETARLEALNESAKEASRKLKAARAKMKPFDPKTQPTPYPREETAAPPPTLEERLGEDERDPKDLAKHEKDAAVVKANPIEINGEPKARTMAEPSWGAVNQLDWEELGKLFTGFSLGYKMGGDFTSEVTGLHGTAVEIEGAVLPIDPPKGPLTRFWLAKPSIVHAKCAYCEAPSPGDLVYVDAAKAPYAADRAQLYTGAVLVKAVGRFLLGPAKTNDGITYIWGMELKELR